MFKWWISLGIYIFIQASLTKSNSSRYNIMSMKDVLHHFAWRIPHFLQGVSLVSQLVRWISEPSTVSPRWLQCLNLTRGSWRILNFEQHGHMKGEQWRLPKLGSDLKKKTKNKCSKSLGCLFQTVISYKYSMYGMVHHHLTYIYPIHDTPGLVLPAKKNRYSRNFSLIVRISRWRNNIFSDFFMIIFMILILKCQWS